MEWKYPLPKINSSCSSFSVHFNFFVPSTFESSIIINCYIHDIMWNIHLVSTQKFFEKLKKIRNVSPSENAAYVLNDWIKPNTDNNLYYTVISWHKSRRSKSISSLYYQFVVSTFCVGRIFCGVIMIQHKHTIKCRTRLFHYERRKKVYGIRLRIQSHLHYTQPTELPLRKKCPYKKFFWSVFFRIRTENNGIGSISPYSVRMRENTEQKNSEYGHFSHSAIHKH